MYSVLYSKIYNIYVFTLVLFTRRLLCNCMNDDRTCAPLRGVYKLNSQAYIYAYKVTCLEW